jgi:hypothetical protein
LVLRDPKATEGCPGSVGRKATLDHWDPKVHQVIKELVAFLDQQVSWEGEDNQDDQVQWEYQDI